jgi:hypothetical protein
MTVSEYVTRFTQLSRYAPNNMDTDEKKHDCFLNGLNDGLAYALETHDFDNLQAMVNKALVLENRRGILKCKRKQGSHIQHCTNSRPRIGSSSTRPIFHPMKQNVQPMPQLTGQGFASPQRQMILHPNNFQTPNNGNQSVQRTPATREPMPTKVATTCFKCGQKGHYANRCPNKRQ